jgi:hypothetical protein
MKGCFSVCSYLGLHQSRQLYDYEINSEQIKSFSAKGRGGQMAREAAHVTLMRGEPSQLRDFFSLAARARRKIRQNLACSSVYNAVGIPVVKRRLIAVYPAIRASATHIPGGSTHLWRRAKRMASAVARTHGWVGRLLAGQTPTQNGCPLALQWHAVLLAQPVWRNQSVVRSR